MKTFSALLTLNLITSLVAAGSATAQSLAVPEIIEIDRIVAVVNDDVIVQSEMQTRMRTVVEQLENSGVPSPPRDVLEKQILEQLILGRLQIQIAESTGIRIDARKRRR